MLINRLRHFILLGIFVRRFEESTVSSMTFSNDSLVRSGRDVGTKYLIFPQGSNVQLVFCLTISTYAKPQGMFTIGSTAGLAWELPYRNTVLYGKPAEVYHRRSRRELYHKVELMLRTFLFQRLVSGKFAASRFTKKNRREPLLESCLLICVAENASVSQSGTQGKDGKACVLKAICKAAGRRREDVGKGSFLEETLHAIFTLPGGQYDIDPMTEYERAYHLGENCDEMHAKCPGVF
ncbi:hypothetical protein ALC56_13179 [Trachymyrmex septentrionalis]|uniref:Uncharacterized protein n=1 Tax=Trachymyrmex septentrionalis TaxID=34720 RepID=A0A195EWP6_9HYME|nr:hypothetical protein ALC56_13179 [Trachymyrmex septentrionalis]